MRDKQMTHSFHHKQKGVAILVITILILLVATIGTLMIGRVGVMEQKVVGTDTRSKELYSAAIGGLEYGVNWMKQTNGANYASLVWSDNDSDDRPEAGDTSSPVQPGNTLLNTGSYAHTITYRLMTDLVPGEYEDRDGDGSVNNLVNIKPIVIRVESTVRPVAVNDGAADTHLSKTVYIDILVNGRTLFSTAAASPGEFAGPPIIVEGCVAGNGFGGNPSVNYDIDLSNPEIIDVAIASTMMNADLDGDGNPDDTLDTCMPGSEMGGHLAFCDVDQFPTSCPNNQDMDAQDALDDPNVPEFRMGLDEPNSLWNTIFGADTTEADLLLLESLDPLNVIYVDSSTLHHQEQRDTYTQWHGQQWHDNLGSPGHPVILYFDDAVGCPAINGSTIIYGLVYYEEDVCGNQGWGGGTVYGSVAKSGDLTAMTANAKIIATGLDFGGTGGGTGDGTKDNYGSDILPVISVLPGTWRDFTD